MSINKKISVGILVILIIFAFCQGAVMHTIISSIGQEEISDMHTDEMEKARQKLRNYIEIAYNIIEANYRNTRSVEWLQKEYGLALNKIVDIAESIIASNRVLVAEGIITVDEAKERSLQAIGRLRYNSETGYIWTKGIGPAASNILTTGEEDAVSGGVLDERAMGYVWVNDMGKPFPKMLMHPTIPELNDRFLDDEKFNCALGIKKNLFVAMVEVTEQRGEGYIDYIWPKPTHSGLDEEKPKLSYVRSVPEWNWIIGTGIYVDDALGKAIEKSRQDLKTMRYNDGEGYFWINDRTSPYPIMIMHPTMPELVGQVLDDEEFNVVLGEPKHLFKAFRLAAEKENGGFVTYMWPKPTREGLTEDQPKLSYVRTFEPFDWIIGTGVYIDSIDKLIAGKISTINSTNYYLLLTILSVAIALFLLLTTASYLLIDRFFIRKINLANDELQQEVDERIKTEKQLREARMQAEIANNAKSSFLANMSHEIRTPMNAVLGLAHLLKQTRLTEQQQDYILKLTLSADNLLSIIDDILDFSKVEAGKLKLETVPFNLHHDILYNVSQVVGLAAVDKGLEMMVDLEPDLPEHLLGDPVRLRQILINLLNNAVKFTDRGEVTLRVTLAERHDREAVLRFDVRDTGIGMSEVEQGNLFTAFTQADASTTRKFGGTGLGLTISKTLTELMGGEIGAESTLGEGSDFWFTVRLQIDHKAKTRKPVLPAKDIRGIKVLVVDDNQTSRMILTRQLKGFGFKVAEAASGEEALYLLQEEAATAGFDLVLVDWKMPAMDGIDTVRHLQTRLELKKKPAVIMLTAYDRKELEGEARDIEYGEILTKPVFPSALLDSIMSAFGIGLRVRNGSDLEKLPSHVLGARILLVEDNAINQQVACEILEKAGLMVTVAEDGAQALQQLQRADDAGKPFDGVLMDIQMPVMDGYTATGKIRSMEGFEELPVIAMTANAMAGDRQKALDAGMNDYVAKPIVISQLFKVLGQWIHLPEERRTPPPELEGEHEPVPPDLDDLSMIADLDTAAGLKIVGGNVALYTSILEQFQANYAQYPEHFASAVAEQDYAAAEHLAHTLKGVAGIIGATALSKAAATFEANLREGDPDTIRTSLAQCSEELNRLLKELDSIGSALPQPETLQPAGDTVNREAQLSVLKTLQDFLLDDDSEAVDYFQTNRGILAGVMGSAEMEECWEYLRNFDFEAALVMVNVFLGKAENTQTPDVSES